MSGALNGWFSQVSFSSVGCLTRRCPHTILEVGTPSFSPWYLAFGGISWSFDMTKLHLHMGGWLYPVKKKPQCQGTEQNSFLQLVRIKPTSALQLQLPPSLRVSVLLMTWCTPGKEAAEEPLAHHLAPSLCLQSKAVKQEPLGMRLTLWQGISPGGWREGHLGCFCEQVISPAPDAQSCWPALTSSCYWSSRQFLQDMKELD